MRKPVMIDNNQMECIDMQKMFAHHELFPYSAHTTTGHATTYLQRENSPNTTKLTDLKFHDLYIPVCHGFDFVEQFERFCMSFQEPISIYIALSSIDENDGPWVLVYPFVGNLKGKLKKYIHLF
ncbi:MAG: hypothetical protein M3O71_27870 [Bacteroidota bacterium]|nr:hypothetical protein [Bacteroidota bacterium]